jgi:hypothetical protein
MTRYHSFKWFLALTLTLGFLASQSIWADDAPAPTVIFDCNFANGDFDHFGWKDKGDKWTIYDYTSDHHDLRTSPGPVAKFGATPKDYKDTELLVRKFTPIVKPDSLTLNVDAGWGWGAAGQSSDDLNVMVLDDDGNGYVFHFHRAKEKWGAQWGVVTKYVPQANLNWSPEVVDGTQAAIVDNGNLKSFSIKRDSHGAWQFGRTDWTTPFAFTEPSVTTSTFSQVALVGTPNFDDLCFNKIHLEATLASDPNAIPKL